MAGARQLLLHFSRSAMLHHTLFGIGWITYRIGWIRSELVRLGQNWLDCGKKQAKGQTASIAFSPDLVQHLTFSIWRSPEENVVQLINWFGRPTEKKLAVFENVSPQRGCQGCVSYHSLPSTFSLKERLPNSSQSFP